jgi:hypothetical protein
MQRLDMLFLNANRTFPMFLTWVEISLAPGGDRGPHVLQIPLE